MNVYLNQNGLKILLFLICLFISVPLIAQSSTETVETEAEMVDSLDLAPPPQPPTPATMMTADDTPNDHGHSIDLTWELSPQDDGSGDYIKNYQVWRRADSGSEFVLRATIPYGVNNYTDRGDKDDGRDPMPNDMDYYYKIVAMTEAGITSESNVLGPVQTNGQFFHTGKIPVAVAVVVFFFCTVFFILRAKQGKKLYVRPISGISAVDEAIGRATEMGKPILYVLGIGTASEIATICSFTILSRVAKKVAEHQTQLTVPCYDPIVMTVAQEIVKNAYTEAGRPDTYDESSVFFVTQSQFAYVAAVNGMMLRDLPASNFYLGYFAAESLLLAETGSLAGSIQIAGTDQVAQLPFFIVACDYTLIGEELYAGSAYLSQEPLLLGSLKAEDWGKAIYIVLALIGVVAATIGWQQFIDAIAVQL